MFKKILVLSLIFSAASLAFAMDGGQEKTGIKQTKTNCLLRVDIWPTYTINGEYAKEHVKMQLLIQPGFTLGHLKNAVTNRVGAVDKDFFNITYLDGKKVGMESVGKNAKPVDTTEIYQELFGPVPQGNPCFEQCIDLQAK